MRFATKIRLTAVLVAFGAAFAVAFTVGAFAPHQAPTRLGKIDVARFMGTRPSQWWFE